MVHARGCFLAVLIIDDLLNGVRAEDMSEQETTDFRYALLGAGIGLFLAVCLLFVKLYMMGTLKCPCTKAQMHNGVYKMQSSTRPQSPTRHHLNGGPCTPDSDIHI